VDLAAGGFPMGIAVEAAANGMTSVAVRLDGGDGGGVMSAKRVVTARFRRAPMDRFFAMAQRGGPDQRR